MDKKAPWKDRPRIYQDIFFKGLGFLTISPKTGVHHCCGLGTSLRVFITIILSALYISWPERRQVTCFLVQSMLDFEKSDLDLKQWSEPHLEILVFKTDKIVRWNVGFSPLKSMHVLCKAGWWPKGLIVIQIARCLPKSLLPFLLGTQLDFTSQHPQQRHDEVPFNQVWLKWSMPLPSMAHRSLCHLSLYAFSPCWPTDVGRFWMTSRCHVLKLAGFFSSCVVQRGHQLKSYHSDSLLFKPLKFGFYFNCGLAFSNMSC